MIIGGKDLQELAREIFPADVGNKIKVGNSSIDICFGRKYKTLKTQILNLKNIDSVQYQTHVFEIGRAWVLREQLYLFESCVPINLPDDITAQVFMRSTAARLALNHQLAGFIDAGFKGNIVFEITSMFSTLIYEDTPIVQLVFTKQSSPAAYKGRYQNQASGVQTAKDF